MTVPEDDVISIHCALLTISTSWPLILTRARFMIARSKRNSAQSARHVRALLELGHQLALV